MDLKHRIERSFKPRFAIIYPFGIYFAIMGVCDETSLRHGIGFIITGMLIRLWSNGYAIKNDKLTTSGPYAFVRNPLYLGTFLIAIGFAITLKTGLAGALFLLALSFVYRQTIQGEEGNLTSRFGNAFLAYKAKVPAMIPCLIPYSEGEKWPFSLQRLIFSKEHKTICWVTVLLIIFHLKSRLLIEHRDMTARTWQLVAVLVLAIAIDVVFELNKKKIK